MGRVLPLRTHLPLPLLPPPPFSLWPYLVTLLLYQHFRSQNLIPQCWNLPKGKKVYLCYWKCYGSDSTNILWYLVTILWHFPAFLYLGYLQGLLGCVSVVKEQFETVSWCLMTILQCLAMILWHFSSLLLAGSLL